MDDFKSGTKEQAQDEIEMVVRPKEAQLAPTTPAAAPPTTCLGCGHAYTGAKYCPECGTPARVFCPKCGTQHANKYCPECGTAAPLHPPATAGSPLAQNIIINNESTRVNMRDNINVSDNVNVAAPAGQRFHAPKNRWMGLLLCVVAGYLGAHQFYAGKVGMGLLYLFTFGLFGIGWVVDILRLLLGNFRDGYGILME